MTTDLANDHLLGQVQCIYCSMGEMLSVSSFTCTARVGELCGDPTFREESRLGKVGIE